MQIFGIQFIDLLRTILDEVKRRKLDFTKAKATGVLWAIILFLFDLTMDSGREIQQAGESAIWWVLLLIIGAIAHNVTLIDNKLQAMIDKCFKIHPDLPDYCTKAFWAALGFILLRHPGYSTMVLFFSVLPLVPALRSVAQLHRSPQK